MAPINKRRRLGNDSSVQTSRSQIKGSRENSSTAAKPIEPPRANIEDTSSETQSSSDDEDRPRTLGASYTRLLTSLHHPSTTGSSRKRRKLDRQARGLDEPEDRPSALVPEVQDEEDGAGTEIEEDEEPQEEPVSGLDSLDPAENADDEDASDPFEVHFANPDEDELSRRLKAIEAHQWKTDVSLLGSVGKQTTMRPMSDAKETIIPSRRIVSLDDMILKKRLRERAAEAMPNFSNVQSALVPPLFAYNDVLYGARTVQNAESLRTMVCLHALNHVFKTRDRILKNTSRLGRDHADSDPNLDVRDQGFTRPKILMLLETRQSCNRYMDTISRLCAPEQQENKKRFQDAFVRTEGRFSEDKPPDFRELFEGNDDNEFRLGVKFTRKTMKYYSQFYNSDIILASPLGLRRAMKSEDSKKADFDFLSSIEIMIVDQADAMLMQNWEHVEFVFDHLNLQPKESHGCDFSRVRQWYLEQNARHLRQTIVFSAYLTPELNGLFSAQMQNVAGKVKLVPEYNGAMLEVGLQVRQTFSRYDSNSPLSDPDDRFKYFTTTIVPSLARQAGSGGEASGTLIFIPSYLDFVRVRNFFSTSQDTRDVTFGSVSEYTELPEIRRARSHFFTGRHSVLLYTGRAHHFRRYQIRGVKKVIMYGLPENPVFYGELVAGFLGASIDEGKLDIGEANARALFSKWDGLCLERIVGSQRAGRMLKENGGDTFEFR